MSGFLGILGAANYLLGGETRTQFKSVWVLFITYLLGGFAGGAVVGILHPLARRRIAAFVVGPLGLLPLVLLLAPSILGPMALWGKSDWIIAAGVAIGLGGGVGYALYPQIVEDI